MRLAAHNLEHIVLGRINAAAVYQRCALGKSLDHFLLMSGRLRHDIVVFHFRGRKIQLVGSLNVRHFFEQVHQLRQIKEFAESRSCPVAGSLGLDFVKRFSVIFLNSSGCLQGSPL